MSNFMQQTSRLALVALLSTAPAFAIAQSATTEPADDTATQTQTEGQVTAESESEGTGAEQPLQDGTAQAPATETEPDADTAEVPTEEVPATDGSDAASDTAEAPADAPAAESDMSSDTAQAPATDAPVEGTDMDADTALAPADGTLQDDASSTTAEAEPEMPAKQVEGQIVMQSDNTILAEDLIGSNVYSSEGEDVGEIDNLIISLEGGVEGVVIGVGGFLGIGEKNVAIEMASLSTTTDDMGNIRLVTNATKADLEAAESFMTADDVAARDAAQTPVTDPAAGGTVPATE